MKIAIDSSIVSLGLRATDMTLKRRPIRFDLGVNHCAESACQLQQVLLASPGCHAAFGTLGKDTRECEKSWKLIEEKSRGARGWMKLRFDHNPALARLVGEALRGWVQRGVLDAEVAWELDVQAYSVINQLACVGPPLVRRLRRGETISRSEDRRRRNAMREAVRQTVMLWTVSWSEHKSLREEILDIIDAQNEVVRFEERLPREPVVQRWLEFSVAPELSVDVCKRLIWDWCQDSLGECGLQWFAIVQGKPGTEGVVYILFPQVCVFSMRIQKLKYGNCVLPAQVDLARVLSANGEHGVDGRRDLLRAWVDRMVDEQNRALEQLGSQWRFDAGLWVEKERCRRLLQ